MTEAKNLKGTAREGEGSHGIVKAAPRTQFTGDTVTLCLLLLLKLMLQAEFDTWGLGMLQASRVTLGSVGKACGFCLVSAEVVRPLL